METVKIIPPYYMWQHVIHMWLTTKTDEGNAPISKEYILLHDILRDALNFDMKYVQRKDELRVGKILRALGFEKTVRRINGRAAKMWVRSVISCITLPYGYLLFFDKVTANS